MGKGRPGQGCEMSRESAKSGWKEGRIQGYKRADGAWSRGVQAITANTLWRP